MSPHLSVVIPLYNEEENIAPLQQQLEEGLAGQNYEIIFVDDGSKDATLAKIDRKPTVRVLAFEKNAGQSAAMYAGIMGAEGDIIILLDGDLQNDPADIMRLVAEVEKGGDLVCGYRAKRRDTVVKRITSRVANFVRSRFIGDGVRDTGCSLKAMRKDCRRALLPFFGMHRFIPALIKNAGFTVVEMPVNHRHRQFGVSKYGLGNRAVKATMDMFGVAWLNSRRVDYRIKPQA